MYDLLTIRAIPRENHVYNLGYNLLKSLHAEPYTKVKEVAARKRQHCTYMFEPGNTGSRRPLSGTSIGWSSGETFPVPPNFASTSLRHLDKFGNTDVG